MGRVGVAGDNDIMIKPIKPTRAAAAALSKQRNGPIRKLWFGMQGEVGG